MKYNGLVSVVMPVHNGEKFLSEAIESVLKQTYTNFELLVIENCSSDKSVEIIKLYKDTRIKLIIEKDCGQIQAYNRGFKEANGELIFIHDQDDISSPERFEKQIKCMIENDVDICGSSFSLIDKSAKIVGEIINPTTNQRIKEELLYKNSIIFNSTVCIRKSVFEKIGYFDVQFFPSADYEFYLRGLDFFRYGNVLDVLYFWRRHREQISNRYLRETSQKTIDISLNYLKKYHPSHKHFYTGLVYYYNNKLIKAILSFVKSFYYGESNPKLVRYLFICIVFGPILKIFRRYHLTHSKFFVFVKKWLNKIF